MNKVVAFSLGVLTCVFFVSCSKNPAKSQVATDSIQAVVSFVEGPVVIIGQEGQRTPASEGLLVPEGSMIESGTGGHCIVSLGPIGTIEMSEDTIVRVDRFVGTEQRSLLSVLSGSVRSKINKLGGKDSYLIRAKSIVCGVRGTEFVVEADDGDTVRVSVDTGSVSVFPLSLLVSKLHPGHDLLPVGEIPNVSVHVSADSLMNLSDELLNALPVLESGTSRTFSVASFNNATDAIMELVVRLSIDGVSQEILEELVITINYAITVSVSNQGNELVENPAGTDTPVTTIVEDQYAYTRTPVANTRVFEVSGSLWPRPAPLGIVGVEKKPSVSMNSGNTVTIVNKEAGDSARVALKNGRAIITIDKHFGFTWGALVEPNKKYLLLPGTMYLAEFTAWTDGAPMMLTSCFNEGGTDLNNDGDKYSLYQYVTCPVTSSSSRYTVVYFHTDKKNPAAAFNVSATGMYPGVMYVQDIVVTAVKDQAYSHDGGENELIRNGSFSYGFLFWEPAKYNEPTLDGFSVTNGILVYDAPGKAGETWKVKTFTEVPLLKEQQYMLAFDVKSQDSGILGIDMVEGGHDKNRDGNTSSANAPYIQVELVPGSWYRYEIVFTALEEDPETRFSFNLGDLQGKTQIDNVSLKMR